MELGTRAAKGLRLVSLILFGLLSVFLIWFGITYATVHNLLWFHAAAVPQAALDDVRPIYFALMKLIGGSSAALGLLSLYMIFGPLRRGLPFAATALAVCNAIPLLTAAFVAEHLRATTGAPTSWRIMGVLLGVDAAAFTLYAISRSLAAAPSPAFER